MRGKQRAFHQGYDRDAHNMTLVQKFEKFMNFLKRDTLRVNAIQSVENACLATGLHLKCDYFCEELPRAYNRQLFTGTLSISGIFLARGVGCNKKEIKHEIYNKALQVLTSKTLEEINDLSDPGTDLVMASVEKYLKEQGPGEYQEGIGVPVYKAMTNIAGEVTKHLESIHRMQIGLSKVIALLKGNTALPDNPIQKVEEAFVKARSGIRHMFVTEGVEIDVGKCSFEGTFIVDDTCIARTISSTKKQSKTDTYEAALEALMNKPMSDLVIPVEKDTSNEEEDQLVKNEAIVAGVQTAVGEGPPPIARPSMIQAPLEDRLKNLRNSISHAAYMEFNNSLIESSATHSGLTTMCIYRRSSPTSTQCIACELYIENYLIATGYGDSRVECALEMYNKAFEVLSNMSPEEIISNHKQMLPSQTEGPTILECVVKKGINHETNIPGLRRLGYLPADKTRSYNSIVIVEAGDWHKDRRNNAFCILQHSATHNGMLLEWTYSQVAVPQKRTYKNESKTSTKLSCEIYINGTKVSEFGGFGRAKLRNFASSDILYKLYETCSVLRIVDQNVSDMWVPFATLSSEASSLKLSGKDADPALTQVDQGLVQAARTRIDNFFKNSNGEELLFGPGIPDLVKISISKYAQSKNLQYEQRMKAGEVYDAVFEKVDTREVVNILKSGSKSSYGRYQLVPKSECPTHEELKGPKSKTPQTHH